VPEAAKQKCMQQKSKHCSIREKKREDAACCMLHAATTAGEKN
jgi:hypothetical protein